MGRTAAKKQEEVHERDARRPRLAGCGLSIIDTEEQTKRMTVVSIARH